MSRGKADNQPAMAAAAAYASPNAGLLFTVLLAAFSLATGCSRKETITTNAPRATSTGVIHAIPRTYLNLPPEPGNPNVEIAYPQIAMTYPLFHPSYGSVGCEHRKVPESHEPCETLLVLISGGKGPTRRQQAQNVRRGLTAAAIKTGVDEYGFNTWWSRSTPDFVNFTRDLNGNFLYFDCFIPPSSSRKITGFCTDIAFMSDGNTAKFYFPYSLRNNLPDIEAGIDRFMARFRMSPRN